MFNPKNKSHRDRRQKVLDYLSTQDLSPLVLVDMYRRDRVFTPNYEGVSVHDMVIDLMTELINYGSLNIVTGYVETYHDRLRSPIDIWRHIILSRPEVTIFEVMKAFYDLRDQLYGHYCITVKRAVFRVPRHFYRAPVRNFRCNEFRMFFSSWRFLQ